MDDLRYITALLKTIDGLYVTSTNIPENATRPAVTFANIAYQNDRVLSGDKTSRVSTWRVTISDSVENLQNTIDQLLSLDNTVNDNYQRIFSVLTYVEPKDQMQPYQRAFIELTLYY